MSSVPKSRREEHDFQAFHKLREIRKAVTDLAINDFGYDREKLEEKIKRFESSLTSLDPEKKAEVVERMRRKNESFYSDFVDEETTETRDILRKAVFEFELGNSVFPSGEAKLMEYCERRKHLNKAVGWMNCLKQELLYIAETLPGDKNRYKSLTEEIETEISMIKGVRRSANRFLKDGAPQNKDQKENKEEKDRP